MTDAPVTPDFSEAAGLPAKAKKPSPFSLRLTFEERARLEREAGSLPLGAYIKLKALSGAPVPEYQTRSCRAVRDPEAIGQLLALLGRARLANNLNQLAQLDGTLNYQHKRKIYYFPAKPDTIEQTYHYTSLKVKTSADVVKRYEKDKKTIYVRHHAFEPRFWRLDDRWLLSISPTFIFTWDGFKPDRFEASRLAGKKKLEVNSSLLGQFVMWRHLLTHLGVKPDADLFESASAPAPEQFLGFQPIDSLSLERGVPDDLWRSSEPEQPDDRRQGRLDV